MRSSIIFLLIAVMLVASTTARTVDIEAHSSSTRIGPFGGCVPADCYNTCKAALGQEYSSSKCWEDVCYCFSKSTVDIEQTNEENIKASCNNGACKKMCKNQMGNRYKSSKCSNKNTCLCYSKKKASEDIVDDVEGNDVFMW
jgi:hypothetical protein